MMTSFDRQDGGDTLKSLACHLEPCMLFMQEIANATGAATNRFHACAHGLRALLFCLDEYDNNLLISSTFYDSLLRNIRDLAGIINRSRDDSDLDAREMAQDLAFQLIEDMAVLLREKYLRSGCEQPLPDERVLIEYFETRGHWKFGDQTLVTEFYYIGLPIAVINSLVSSLS